MVVVGEVTNEFMGCTLQGNVIFFVFIDKVVKKF